jgi:hypothetical protein
MTRLANGWRVPDANVWTGELVPYPLTFAWDDTAQDVRLSYLDPADEDWMFNVLWPRHGQDRSGRHKWRGVNAIRQRSMMLDHLCMVCTAPATEADRISWVFHTDPGVNAAGELVTNIPPTCRSCIPEALATCPPLQRQSRVCTAAGSRPYAVEVDLYMPGPTDESAVRAQRGAIVEAENLPVLRFCLAKALLVAVDDLRDEPIP